MNQNIGQAIVAMELIDFINAEFGASIPQVNMDQVLCLGGCADQGPPAGAPTKDFVFSPDAMHQLLGGWNFTGYSNPTVDELLDHPGVAAHLAAGLALGLKVGDLQEVEDAFAGYDVHLYRSPGHARNFIDCVKSGAQPSSSMADAVKTILPWITVDATTSRSSGWMRSNHT